MPGRYIQLPNAEISAIEDSFGRIKVRIGDLRVVKSEGIPGVNESTLWRNAATVEFEEAEIDGDLPALPARVTTGDITLNGITYRDMIALPLDQNGFAELELSFAGGAKVTISASERIRIELDGPGNYIEHIAATKGR